MAENEYRAPDMELPIPPGDVSLAEASPREFKTSFTGEAPGERADYPAPGMPSQWQLLADWLSQPPPAFGGAANAVHFYMNHTDGIGYQGLMYFKAATPPFNYFSRNRFYGTGHIYPNVPWGEWYKVHGPGQLPAPWARLVIALRAAGGIAGLTLHDASGSGALPGPQVGWAEEDVRELLGAQPHFVTSLGRWILYLEFTTALLGV